MPGWLIVSLHLKFLSLEKIVSETDYLQVNYGTTELIRRQAYMLLVWMIDWKRSYWMFLFIYLLFFLSAEAPEWN